MSNSPAGALVIRPCEETDVESLADLLGLLFVQEADFAANTDKQVRALRQIISSPALGLLYCATHEGKIIGMVSLLFTISTAEGGRAAWLEDMIVHPKWRGFGVGAKLLHTAIDAARISGCCRITLLTDRDNSAAQQFYERAAFVRSQMVPYRRMLGEE